MSMDMPTEAQRAAARISLSGDGYTLPSQRTPLSDRERTAIAFEMRQRHDIPARVHVEVHEYGSITLLSPEKLGTGVWSGDQWSGEPWSQTLSGEHWFASIGHAEDWLRDDAPPMTFTFTPKAGNA